MKNNSLSLKAQPGEGERANNLNSLDSLEFVVQSKELIRVLSFASSIVEKKNIKQEYGTIKLSTKDGRLEVGSTDMDMYLNQNIGAKTIKEGQTTVTAPILNEIVKKITDQEIIFKKEKESRYLQIIGSSFNFDLLTLPASEFPQMEDLKEDSFLTVDSGELIRIIEYTAFAMSTEETRYNLNGIYLHSQRGRFSSAATDGHRFSIATSRGKSDLPDFGVIIPQKTVFELLKLLKDSQNIHPEVTVTLGVNRIKFTSGRMMLISKLIDGNFPEYENFIPKDNNNRLLINAKMLSVAIDRVATVTINKFKAIKLEFTEESLIITASVETKGNASEKIGFSEDKEKYCSYKGSNMTIGFNPKYLVDVLNALKEEQAELYLKDAASPILIKTAENPEDSFVVMPVKV